MELATRTLLGAYIQDCLLLRRPISYPPNTTLNEKFGILNDQLPSISDIPFLGYMSIGNKGHGFTAGADGIPEPTIVPHRGTDASLYGHIPFVLRPLNNDLTASERDKYALRREELIGGIRYAAYYLKRINMDNVTPQMLYTVVNNGQETTTPYNYTSANLNPTPPDIGPDGKYITSADYVAASAIMSLSLSEVDAQELLNMSAIKFGTQGKAIISEIALCTGVDKVVQVTPSTGGQFNMREAIGVQIASILASMYPVRFANQGVDISVNVGVAEPLFSIEAE